MNSDVLRDAHPHVREEHEKLRSLLGVEERALLSATRAFLRAANGEELDLPGEAPSLDAAPIEWVDYFLIRCSVDLAVLRARDAAEQPTLFEATAAA